MKGIIKFLWRHRSGFLIYFFVPFLIVLCWGIYSYDSGRQNTKPAVAEQEIKEEAETADVVKEEVFEIPGAENDFTDVQVQNWLDEYFLSIPTGNISTCVWRYSQGNDNIPYMVTTTVKTSKEKHNIKIEGVFWDFSVYCFDDFEKNYRGILDMEKLDFPDSEPVAATSSEEEAEPETD